MVENEIAAHPGPHACRRFAGRHDVWSLLALAAVLLWAVSAVGCSHPQQKRDGAGEDLLYTVGDTSLTVAGVVAQIPPGLDPADSLALFNAIADDWLYSMLLEQEAQLSHSEREQVESQVRQYRQRLLAARYRESVAAANAAEVVPEAAVRAEYEARKGDYVLQAPMVKGILVQLPASSPDLAQARRWMAEPTMANIDRLEKTVLPSALQYEYFLDDWQDWRDISSLIPYRFPEAEKYVATHPVLDKRIGASVYLLTVTDHLATGRQMPYSEAAPLIRAEIMRRSQGDADRIILRNLRQKALRNGTLKEYKR